MTYSKPAQVAGGSPSEPTPRGRVVSHRGIVRPSRLWAAAVVALGVTVAGCSGGSTVPTVGSAGGSASAAAAGSGSGSRSPKRWPTPSAYAATASRISPTPCRPRAGDTGTGPPELTRIRLRSKGPSRPAGPCRRRGTPPAKQLSPAQQQAWLNWAQCIRAHGVPDFPDPTFSGSEVRDSGVGSSSPQLQSAMDACKSQMPSVGGLGG